MRCPLCQQEHPDGARFCPVTGQLIPAAVETGMLCPRCGQPVQPQWAACPYCHLALQEKREPSFPWVLILMGLGMALLDIGIVLLVLQAANNSQAISRWQQQTAQVQYGTQTMQAQRAERTTQAGVALYATQQQQITRTARAWATRQAVRAVEPTPRQTEKPTQIQMQPVATVTPRRLPTEAPASRQVILFSRGKDGDGEIYALDPQTGVEHQLTSNIYQDEGPSAAPEGDRIIFSSFRGGSYQLVTKDLRTGVERQITDVDGKALFPDWSPVAGDDRILFEWVNADKYSAVGVVNADGSGLKTLTRFGADSRPHWSPDGSMILFARALRDSYNDGKITAADYMDLFQLNLASGAETQLTDTPDFDDYDGCWSPDMTRIAFGSVRGDANSDRFINLDDAKDLFMLSGFGVEKRIDLGGLRPFSMDWSEDGRYIVFTADKGSSTDLWLLEVSTGRTRRLNASGAALHSEWGYLIP